MILNFLRHSKRDQRSSKRSGSKKITDCLKSAIYEKYQRLTEFKSYLSWSLIKKSYILWLKKIKSIVHILISRQIDQLVIF
jgi:hypothetical protein